MLQSRAIAATLLALLLSGCAAQVPARAVSMAPLTTPQGQLQFGQSVPVTVVAGYESTVPAGSRWEAVGTLAEGVVYRPVNTVFSIQGRNVHEAWLVVTPGMLQGFYLPAESNFTPLRRPLPLSNGVQP